MFENYQKPQRMTQGQAELYFVSLDAQVCDVQDLSNVDPLGLLCQEESQKELLEEVSSQIQKDHREKYKRILEQIMECLPIVEIGKRARKHRQSIYDVLARLRKILDAKELYEKFCYRQSVSYTPYTLTSQKLKTYKILKAERQSLKVLKNPAGLMPDIHLLMSCSNYPSSFDFNCFTTPSSVVSFSFSSLPVFPSFFKNFYIENNFKFKKQYKKIKIEKAEQKTEIKPVCYKAAAKAKLETRGERLKREEAYFYG